MQVKRSKSRIDILAILLVFIFCALISRLGYLQVVQGKYYERLADGNRIRLVPIMAPRGVFYDRNGVTLVSNRPGFTLSVSFINKAISDDVIAKMAEILEISPKQIKDKIANKSGSYEPITIKSDIGPEFVTKIEEHKHELPGVAIDIQPIRNYVDNELAAHIFGYVSEISDWELAKLKDKGYKAGQIVGKSGLERVYDLDLRGVDGGNQIEVDVTGRVVQILGKRDPVPGNNLILTLDYRIQRAAEKAIDEQLQYLQTDTRYRNAKAAAAVVMNPQTGEILAMVSRPVFNPNLFAAGISYKEWEKISSNPFHPMDNKAISGEYPPGSTFKIVTGTAALELKKVTPEEKILDTGKHWLIPKGNAEGEALGWINFKEALSKSDNVYFYEMGNRLGIDNLEKYARMFGLGAKTGIKLLGESEGLVANKKYKEKVFGEDWYLAETFDAAIGQGFQLATPLQLAMMISQIANGGQRYQPYLVDKITSPAGQVIKTFEPEKTGSINISAGTLQLIRQSLREVALEGGTGAFAFHDFPIPIAGKTGTAENSHGSDHGLFVAYAPFDSPRIAVAVIVEQGGFGAGSAVPIAKKILEAAFNVNQPLTVNAKVLTAHTAL